MSDFQFPYGSKVIGGPASAFSSNLFIGDAEAGSTAAALYTLIESARRRGLDPEAYLTSLITRLPALKQSDLPNWTPAAWTKAQKTHAA